MKAAIYFSGIAGAMLLITGLLGLMLGNPFKDLMFIAGLIFFVTIFIPLLIVDYLRRKRKTNQIINSYKNSGKEKQQFSKGDSKTKGWGLNNSPFRERKSGLSWGGGNIKGSTAKRGSRRTFLKK